MVVSAAISVSDFHRSAVSAVGVVVRVLIPARGRNPLVISHSVVNADAVVIVIVVDERRGVCVGGGVKRTR